MSSNTKTKVTVIPGDGIGPEVTEAALKIAEAAGVSIEWVFAEAGEKSFKRGIQTGVPQETIDSITDTGLLLKGPLATPIGFGEKSANVTLRKIFGCYGNIRPTREIPGVKTPFSDRGIDLIVVRENVEDLYTGIEHMQTPEVAQCLKLISREGCERIVRLAFELAVAENRKTVHCATKANIMKLTEGLFKKVFEEIAPEYPDIEAHHIIIDNCAHQLVINPEQFDVIVSTNMNGDILSDLTSGLVGGLGIAPSANYGDNVVIFEAVHGTAPTIAGQDMANPTAMTLSMCMLLRHLGMSEQACTIENALYYTLSVANIKTIDLANGQKHAGTQAFTDAIISHFGKGAELASCRVTKPMQLPEPQKKSTKNPMTMKTIGVDIFIAEDMPVSTLGKKLEAMTEGLPLNLKMISSRGLQVYPADREMPENAGHWQCRFISENKARTDNVDIVELLGRIGTEFTWVHIEKLQEIQGENAFTRVQGESNAA